MNVTVVCCVNNKCCVTYCNGIVLCSRTALINRFTIRGGTKKLFCKSKVSLKALHSSPKVRLTSPKSIPKSLTLSFESLNRS